MYPFQYNLLNLSSLFCFFISYRESCNTNIPPLTSCFSFKELLKSITSLLPF